MNYVERIFGSFREQLQANVSRSDILKPLSWLIGLLLSASVGMVYTGAPHWLLGAMIAFLALAIGLYGFAYIYCLLWDRDALRSEKFETFARECRVIWLSPLGAARGGVEAVLGG